MIHEYNPHAKAFKMAKDRFIDDKVADIKLKLISTRGTNPRSYNLPTTAKVAALIVGDIDSVLDQRDIVLEKQGDGFKIDILVSDVGAENRKRTRDSMRDFFAFRL
ncbi:hypothetical protein V2J09_017872 [Rumex salicifolius]